MIDLIKSRLDPEPEWTGHTDVIGACACMTVSHPDYLREGCRPEPSVAPAAHGLPETSSVSSLLKWMCRMGPNMLAVGGLTAWCSPMGPIHVHHPTHQHPTDG
ncbi:hypothetical protein XENOCAPTIV_025002 [Xenoophorus captivus]|uniref:Uncharacterized protein n=1 Tax=Xenoophorus captivus TaxID=1517983 RepID=A0ABV0SE41_9TELE